MRKGVTFHNGKAVTADDVVASIRHHMGRTRSRRPSRCSEQSRRSRPTARTSSSRCKGGNADFPYLMSDYHLPIMPAADGKADWQSGVRTGPYMLEKFEPGVRAHAEAQPELLSGRLASMMSSFTVIADVAARTNALTTGEVNYIDRCDLKTLDLLKQNPDIEITEVDRLRPLHLRHERDTAPFDKSMFAWRSSRPSTARTSRRRCSSVTPPPATTTRSRLRQVRDQSGAGPQLRSGEGEVPPEEGGLRESEGGPHRSPMPPSTARSMPASSSPSSAKVPVSTINVVREPDDSLLGQCLAQEALGRVLLERAADGDWMFTTVYAADAAWNDTHWTNPRFNELLVAARVGDGRCQARQHVCRDAAARCTTTAAWSSSSSTTIVERELRRPTRPWRDRRQLGARRHEDRRALVVCLIIATLLHEPSRAAFGAARCVCGIFVWRPVSNALTMSPLGKPRAEKSGRVTHASDHPHRHSAAGVELRHAVRHLDPDHLPPSPCCRETSPRRSWVRRPRRKPSPPFRRRSVSINRRSRATSIGSRRSLSAISARASPAMSATGGTVAEIIGPRLKNTLFLAAITALIAVPLALFLGVLAALYRNGWFDRIVNALTLTTISFPEFFVAYMLMLFFAVKWHILPSLSNVTPGNGTRRAALSMRTAGPDPDACHRCPHDAHDARRHHQSDGEPLHRDGAPQGYSTHAR